MKRPLVEDKGMQDTHALHSTSTTSEQAETVRTKTQKEKEVNILVIAVCLLVGNGLYQYKATETCPYDGLYECLDKFLLPNLAQGLIVTALSALIFTYLLWTNISSRHKQKTVILMVVISNIALMSATNTTIQKNKFGALYCVAFILFMTLMLLVLMLRSLYIKFVRPHMNTGRAIILWIIILLYCGYVYKFKVMTSCSNWIYGLSGEMS